MLERESGRYLLTQRAANASLPLLWEFPGGRAHDGETDETALVRELKERLNVDVIVEEEATKVHHEYPEYDIDFHVFHCRLADASQDISHDRIHDHRWVTLEEMGDLSFPPADSRTVAKLLDLDS